MTVPCENLWINSALNHTTYTSECSVLNAFKWIITVFEHNFDTDCTKPGLYLVILRYWLVVIMNIPGKEISYSNFSQEQIFFKIH